MTNIIQQAVRSLSKAASKVFKSELRNFGKIIKGKENTQENKVDAKSKEKIDKTTEAARGKFEAIKEKKTDNPIVPDLADYLNNKPDNIQDVRTAKLAIAISKLDKVPHVNQELKAKIAEFKQHVSPQNPEQYFDTVISKMTKDDVDALLQGAPDDIYVKVKEARLRNIDSKNIYSPIDELLEIIRDPKVPKESHIEITKNQSYQRVSELGMALLSLERRNEGLLSDALKLNLKEHKHAGVRNCYIANVKLSEQDIDTILQRKEIDTLDKGGMSKDMAEKIIHLNYDYNKIEALVCSAHRYDASVTDDIFKYAINLTDEYSKDEIISNLVSRQHPPLSSDRINYIFDHYKDKIGNQRNNNVIANLLQSERPLPDKIIDHFIENGNDKTTYALLKSKRILSDDQAHALMNKLLDEPFEAYSTSFRSFQDFPMRYMCEKYPQTLTDKNINKIVVQLNDMHQRDDSSVPFQMSQILKDHPKLSPEQKAILARIENE